jgi:sulfate transport system permease protein
LTGSLVRWAVLGYISILVGVPLAILASTAFSAGIDDAWATLASPATISALGLTLWTALVVVAVNAVFGTLTAWVLVRYRFPGRRVLSALVDLPFAIPTLVTGLMLVLLFGPERLLGEWLKARGIEILFNPPAIVLALLFITVPFVVRAVEPILAELDPAEEEAAYTLGARGFTIFRKIILPAIMPAILLGSLQAYARALAEFGSIVVVAGNIPGRTLTAPVLVFSEIESGRPERAALISLVLLVLAFALSMVTRALRVTRRMS